MKPKFMKIIILFLVAMMIIPGLACEKPTEIKTENPEKITESKESKDLKEIKFDLLADTKTIETTDYIEFYVGNSVCHVNGKKTKIDANNQNVAPYLKNGQVYLPLRFMAESFGGTIEWDDKIKTAILKTKKGKIYNIAANLNSELKDDRTYVPFETISEIFGKSMLYERGLIIIGDEKQLPDKVKDKAKIDKLITDFTGITNIGTKEKFVELLGFDPSEEYKYYNYSGIYDDEIWLDYDMSMGIVAATGEPMDQVETEVVADSPAPAKADGGSDENTGLSSDDSADFSETNTQVKGVDEADIIKTDGQYIYYVRNQTIEIVKANSDGSFEYMSSFEMPENDYFNFSDIFVDGNKIIAIGGYYNHKANGYYTKAVVINTEDKKSPKFERSVEVMGNYVTSRKIGSSVYFTVNQYIYGYFHDDITPVYCDTAKSDDIIETGYENIRCFPAIYDRSITSLVGFNIDRPDEEAFIETFLGCGNNIYMSEKAMYIAGISYNKNTGEHETVINKFMADDGKLVFVKTGTAPGNILNQFSMDEYNSYFRIVTNVNSYKNGRYDTYNGLYIFDNTMQIIGQIDDIAPGEYIYSARFMGNRAFMVTFRTVDPLFALDLSDPRNPVVMGALKIPGYSNYLHPYDENHLIGFGKDTVVDSYGGAFYTSMKVSLFDVTDITNPIEMFVETIGDRGTESELLYNHKALLFSKEKNLLAFPVVVYESKEKAVDGKMPQYGTFAFSGAYVYDIDLTKGFSLRGKISHLTNQDMLKSSDWGGNSDLYINRLITIQNRLYAASNGKLTSHELKTLKILGELSFSDR